MHSLHGTLIGYSDGLGIVQARKIAALTGLTWRQKNANLLAGSDFEAPYNYVVDVKIHQITTNKENNGLRQMVIEMDGLWIAVCYIKESIVVSALIEKDFDPNEEKERAEFRAARLAAKAKEKAGLEGAGDNPTANIEKSFKIGKEGNSDGKEPGPDHENHATKEIDAATEAATVNDTSTHDRCNSVSSNHSGSTVPLTENEWDDMCGRNEPPVEHIPHDREPSKIQILKWKAEGMAAVMLKDMKDFKMPANGY